MKVKRILLAVVFASVLALFGWAVVLVVIPPWKSRIPCIVQGKILKWTGIYFHRFHTGTLRFWDERGQLIFEHDYNNGERHGRWIEYDAGGRKKSVSEYRNGDPWDGVCYIYDMKAWRGEYRQGKPWNGCLPVFDSQARRNDSRYFIEGQEVSEQAYKSRYQIPENHRCIGLHP